MGVESGLISVKEVGNKEKKRKERSLMRPSHTVNDVVGSCRGNPLPGVYPSINPHSRPVRSWTTKLEL